MATVYLALGSNLGDRAANLERALTLLRPAVEIARVSGVYETEPWGFRDQPWFYNLVAQGTTTLTPEELLQWLQGVERRMGRRQTVRYGPRVIDLDLLFYDDRVLDSDRLTLPHPRLHERAFVLRPLAEIAPDLRHPRLGLTVGEMLARLTKPEEVRYLGWLNQ